MIEISRPGKLYLAGEYSVVEPGNSSIIMAVDSFTKIKIWDSSQARIKTYKNLETRYKIGKELTFSNMEPDLSLVRESLITTFKYLRARNIEFKYFNMEISSEMNSEDGRKYGLGSSGSIIVSIVEAVTRIHGVRLSNMELFKLASITEIRVNESSSCGDIAAISYGGIILYRSFDRALIKDSLKNLDILSVLKMDWEGLEIRPLNIPENFNFYVGWTGSPSKTSKLVASLDERKKKHEAEYRMFLSQSEKLVGKIAAGMETENLIQVMENIELNRRILRDLERELGLKIETERLGRLSEIGRELGAVGKSSGAGGGDCGLIVSQLELNLENLKEKFELAGIEYLDLNIWRWKFE